MYQKMSTVKLWLATISPPPEHHSLNTPLKLHLSRLEKAYVGGYFGTLRLFVFYRTETTTVKLILTKISVTLNIVYEQNKTCRQFGVISETTYFDFDETFTTR